MKNHMEIKGENNMVKVAVNEKPFLVQEEILQVHLRKSDGLSDDQL